MMMVTEPSLIELVTQLRQATGQFVGGMPVSPEAAWNEGIQAVCRYRAALEDIRARDDDCGRLARETLRRWQHGTAEPPPRSTDPGWVVKEGGRAPHASRDR